MAQKLNICLKKILKRLIESKIKIYKNEFHQAIENIDQI